jgi:hypothetical protein
VQSHQQIPGYGVVADQHRSNAVSLVKTPNRRVVPTAFGLRKRTRKVEG